MTRRLGKTRTLQHALRSTSGCATPPREPAWRECQAPAEMAVGALPAEGGGQSAKERGSERQGGGVRAPASMNAGEVCIVTHERP